MAAVAQEVDNDATTSSYNSEYGGETSDYYEGGKKIEWAKTCKGSCDAGKCVVTQNDLHRCFA